MAYETGNMIRFKSGNLTRISSNMPLKMLVTNTKVGRNTKALVAGVSERTLRHPEAMKAVFTAVDSISQELSAIIQSPALDEISITEKEEKLEELMEMNQGLLQCMGVSHASIETVLRTTLKYKLASKLTGAGGGGCVLTLLPTCIHLLVLFIFSGIKLETVPLISIFSFRCFCILQRIPWLIVLVTGITYYDHLLDNLVQIIYAHSALLDFIPYIEQLLYVSVLRMNCFLCYII